MKTLGRTLIILLAAFIVIGATVALANAGLLSNFSRFPGERGGFGEFEQGQFPPGEFQRPEGDEFAQGFRPERGPGGREGGFGRGFNLFSWIKNIAIISLLVIIVVGLERLFARKRRPVMVANAPVESPAPTAVEADPSVSDENS
ncbi:MAG: hypothetical protein HUU38_18610 [Anaerolineales bacterium]|nr:hypothetical protein [Anaerolineales bacterium]